MNSILKGTRTKIIATMGPATNDENVIAGLIDSGVDTFRLNFSHGSHQAHLESIQKVRQEAEKKDYPITILLDLQGPKIRVDKFESPVLLEKNSFFTLKKGHFVGNENEASLSYPEIIDELNIGDFVQVNDGLISLQVVEKDSESLKTVVIQGGEISSHKGVNIPGSPLKNIPALTEKDIKDLNFGLDNGVDVVAISFVRDSEDIVELRALINRHPTTKKPLIIAKIEKPQALDNIKKIIEYSDGIMVARGDLGVEMNITLLPSIQRYLISEANKMGKIVITATQMLDSMTQNFLPTRAEVTDVSNAVLDGTDAVMLSGETSVGVNPIHVVNTMNQILNVTEEEIFLKPSEYRFSYPEFINHSGYEVAKAVSKLTETLPIKAVICLTNCGYTPLLLSKTRPKAPIIAYSNNKNTQTKLGLLWGVIGKIAPEFSDFREFITFAEEKLLESEDLSSGDLVVFVLGVKLNKDNSDLLSILLREL